MAAAAALKPPPAVGLKAANALAYGKTKDSKKKNTNLDMGSRKKLGQQK
jgi:hypothetical protein